MNIIRNLKRINTLSNENVVYTDEPKAIITNTKSHTK